MPDSSASNLPPSSPATPVRKLLQLFTKADPNHQRLSPTLAGHILISSAIILAGVSLYGISFGLIFALSNTWKVCPQGQVATESTSVAVPLTPTTVPSQRPSIAPVTPTAVPFPATTSTATPARPGSLSLDPAAQQPDLRQLYENIDRLGNDVSASQKIRLKTQLIQFQQAQQISCQIGVFFFANRNAALTVCTAAGILSIASLAFVSKNGWEDTNNAFINIGLTSGLVLFTTWTFSQLYGQGVNYENQKAKVILATDMLNRVASATANGSNAAMVTSRDPNGASKPLVINLSTSKDMASLINALDDQLRILTNLDFSGDSSFAEQSAKRFGDLLNNTAKPVLPTPAPNPAPP